MVKVMPENPALPLRERVLAWGKKYILPRVWYVHPPGWVQVYATQDKCLETMIKAGKPSTKQLHLQRLYVDGRRYHISPNLEGFKMTVTRKIRWRYRGRTSYKAVMRGRFTTINDDITRIDMKFRVRVEYLLYAVGFPLFVASVVLPMGWGILTTVELLGIIFLLSWSAHRFNTRLEAHDMLWFVHKALEDFERAELVALESDSKETSVLYDREDFQRAWDAYLERHQKKQTDRRE